MRAQTITSIQHARVARFAVAVVALVVALGETRLPAHDVHGRSTIVQLSWPELERRFGRQ